MDFDTEIEMRGSPKTGRPLVELDEDQFEHLCELQCEKRDIAEHFGVSRSTILRWVKRTYGKTFEEVYKVYATRGKTSLRRIQYAQAPKSARMAIWLGKQWLGQTEKVDIRQMADDEPTEYDIEKLTDEELKTFEALLRKMAVESDTLNGGDGEDEGR